LNEGAMAPMREASVPFWGGWSGCSIAPPLCPHPHAGLPLPCPLICLPCPAVSLFGLYLLLKYLPDLNIQTFLNAYFWLLGGISIIGSFAPTMRSLVRAEGGTGCGRLLWRCLPDAGGGGCAHWWGLPRLCAAGGGLWDASCGCGLWAAGCGLLSHCAAFFCLILSISACPSAPPTRLCCLPACLPACLAGQVCGPALLAHRAARVDAGRG
jgi:hypothetical protein